MKSNNHPQPRSLSDLFFSFTLLGLQGFVGVLALVQREMVERNRWLTKEEFVEEWAVAQIMTGPNGVNPALMIGGRYFGLPGTLLGVLITITGILLPSTTLTYLSARWSHQNRELCAVRAFKQGIGPS